MKRKHKILLTIGVVILCILLFVWLEFAFLSGDTDVSAQLLLPLASSEFLA